MTQVVRTPWSTRQLIRRFDEVWHDYEVYASPAPTSPYGTKDPYIADLLTLVEAASITRRTISFSSPASTVREVPRLQLDRLTAEEGVIYRGIYLHVDRSEPPKTFVHRKHFDITQRVEIPESGPAELRTLRGKRYSLYAYQMRGDSVRDIMADLYRVLPTCEVMAPVRLRG